MKMVEWVNQDMQNDVYVNILHVFHVNCIQRCKFEIIHLIFITVDNDFVNYNSYT